MIFVVLVPFFSLYLNWHLHNQSHKMVKIYENSVNCAVFMATLNIYANGRLIGESANRIKNLLGAGGTTTFNGRFL